MIAREQREYQLADLVLVPSTFAARTFIEQGMSPSKICVVPLGVDVDMFRPSEEVAEARRQRILAGNPIRVGYVGALSLQKGLLDLIAIAKATAGRRFELHCTGAPTPDGLPLLAELRRYAHVHPAVPQRELPATYARTDLFVFPTLQDGFGMVVSQALAAGLPVLSSENCCGPDILQEGVTGWVVPARRTERYIGCLEWCDENRAEFAAMADHVYRTFTPRTWAQCAGHLMSSLEPFVTPQTARRIPA
jgi:glycosyltransferase involved in cell wall biosynthesis